MKKLFVAALAVLGFAACSNDEVLDAPRSAAITFDNAFIDNATRAAADPSTTSATIDNFEVWAFIDRYTGVVFEDEDVKKEGNIWVHENAQYWTPNHTYYFAALSPMNSANVTKVASTDIEASKLGLGEVTFTNVDGSEDLLYAKEQVVTGDNVSGVQKPVQLQFQHLLSKVKFTFTNGFVTNNATIEVSDIKMTAPKGATIDLAQADYSNAWELNGEEIALEFGNVENTLQNRAKAESEKERLTIPASADQIYTISFNVKLYLGDVLALDVDKTSAVSGIALEMGKAYNFQAEVTPENLELKPIEFAVSVDEWVPEGGIDKPAVAGTPVSTIEELQAFLDNAQALAARCVFVKDITGNVTIEQKEGVNIVIDGDGKKFDGVITVNGKGRSKGKETLKIENVNFETAHSIDTKESEWTFISAPSKINNVYNYSHNVTIENCTFKNTVDGNKRVGSANFTGTYNFVMKNCTATNMHSLLQTQSCDNTVYVENVNAVDCKSGVSFGNTAYPTIKNSTIDAIAYGIRADGNASRGNLVAENVTINASQPIIVRKTVKAGYSIALANVALTTESDYHVIFTQGDDEAEYVAPAVDFSISGADEYFVFPEVLVAGTSEKLSQTLAAGASLVYLKSGDYTLANSLGNTQTEIAIVGNGIDNTTVNGGTTSNNQQPGVYANGKNLVFKNLTYVTPNNGYQGGFGHAASVTFINCKIVGQYYAHSGAPHTFIDCTIDPLTGYLYTYASDCVFEGCTFESSEGKALQVYEDASTGENTVSIKDCTFTAAKVASTWDGKPVTAIDINSNGAVFNVTVEDCTATGYGVGLNSNSNLWNIKNNAQKVNLTVDGELKSIEGFGIVNGWYAIDNTYTVLTAAGFKDVATTVLADGSKNVAIELANDINLAGIEWPVVKTSAEFVLDGKGHSIKNLTTSAVEDHGFYSTAMFTSTRKPATIKNLVVENATVTGNGLGNSHGAVLVSCNYSSLSIEGVTVKNSKVSNCDRTGGLVTYLYFTEATVKDCSVEGCEINSIGTAGAVLGMNNSHDFTITGCSIKETTVSSSEGNNKAGIIIGTWQDAGTLTSEGNTHTGSKAINAGVETNNEIGRHV